MRFVECTLSGDSDLLRGVRDSLVSAMRAGYTPSADPRFAFSESSWREGVESFQRTAERVLNDRGFPGAARVVGAIQTTQRVGVYDLSKCGYRGPCIRERE